MKKLNVREICSYERQVGNMVEWMYITSLFYFGIRVRRVASLVSDSFSQKKYSTAFIEGEDSLAPPSLWALQRTEGSLAPESHYSSSANRPVA